jgi:predicted NBD/HSP70 family sugar kinase
MTRADLARVAGLARSTISSVVAELSEHGVLLDMGTRPDRAPASGRPGTVVALNPRMGAAVGLDFGFRHIRAALADASYEVVARAQADVGIDYSSQHGLDVAAQLVAKVVADAAAERVLGVGVGVPAPVDATLESPTRSSLIPRWAGVRVGEELRARLNYPVFVDNDANLAARAEMLWGAGQGCPDFLYFKLHSGVGGALVAGGRVARGHLGGAGEFGHISLDPNGPLCRCGSRGCLETYASVPAVLAALRPSYGGSMTAERLLALLADGDPACQRVLEEAGARVGQAAAIACNIFNPGRVVIGGLLSETGDSLMSHVRPSLLRWCLPLNSSVEVVRGRLGRDAAALGGIGLAMAQSSLSA